MIKDTKTPQEVENDYRANRVTEIEVQHYLDRWNAGNHYTRATLMDGRIRCILIPEEFE